MNSFQCNKNMTGVFFIMLLLAISALCSQKAYALTINNGASITNTPNVTLQLNKPNGTYSVGVSNEGGSQTSFSYPGTSIPWTLSANEGLKTVSVTYNYQYSYSCQVSCGSYCCGGYDWLNRCNSWCTQYCNSTCTGYGYSSESATITLNSKPDTATGAMTVAREGHTATLLSNGKVLVTGGYNDSSSYLKTAEIYDSVTGAFTTTTGTMTAGRSGHTATLLPNGKVLVTGGFNDGGTLNTSELYDPATGAFTATTGTMLAGRGNHTATLLPNGKVLVTGGFSGSGILNTAEIFDPATGSFSATAGSMTVARNLHTVTLLLDGKVLVTGGYNASGTLNTAEIFNPATGTFTATTGSMTSGRYGHSATLLPSGSVLVSGGYNGSYLNSLEVYSPSTGTFITYAGTMTAARGYHTATLLPNGKVYIAGGYNSSGGYLSSAEIYDPVTGIFTATTKTMTADRYGHTATLLASGSVLVTGGYNGGYLDTAEIYAPAAGTFSVTSGNLWTARGDHTTTLLPNGNVLVTGGYSVSGGYLRSAEIYIPPSRTFTPAGTMAFPRQNHTATLLTSGKVLVTGGIGGGENRAEIYDPATGTFTATGTMTVGRYGHTATLLPNGKVLVTGGSHGYTRAEIYDPATGIFTATAGTMRSDRTYHTASLLPNGTVLLTGGAIDSSSLNTAEIYDPATENFTATTGTMTTYRAYQSATLLQNGKVLVAGGFNSSSGTLNTAEIYDPATGTFTATKRVMTVARARHTPVLLPNGKALVIGGDNGSSSLNTAESYDPATEIFTTTTGTMTANRRHPAATLLANGNVLISGGYASGSNSLSTAEIYDAGLGYGSGRQPVISGITSSSGNIILTGTRFMGVSEGSSGATSNSSSGIPILLMQRIEGGDLHIISPNPSANWSSTSFTFTASSISDLPNGYYLFTLIANGVPSNSSIADVAPFISISPSATKDFGSVPQGSSSTPQTYTVTNNGLKALHLGSIYFNGVNPTQFGNQNDMCSNNTVSPLSTCTFDVLFSPNGSGAMGANLVVPSDAPTSGSSLYLNLSGISVVPVNGSCGLANGGVFTAAPENNLCAVGTPTAVSLTVPWTWSCTGSDGGTTDNCSANILTAISITKSGTGAGTVTSSPSGIDCGATCSAPFPYGSTVVLFQSPGTASGFSGWGDACSGTGDCAFSMSSDKGVTANFTSSPMVKNQRTGIAYSLLQTACTEASGGDTLMALATLPAAALTLDAAKSLTIEGGYASDYASCNGLTPITGPISIKSLTRVNGLAIRSLASSTKEITAFSFASPAAEGILDEATHSITITVPSGTDVTALVPTITHTGASISPAAGIPRDFTNPGIYSVTAENSTTQEYTVTVTVTAATWSVCGDTFAYAGENYPTVQIGTQCWTARNLNIGSFVTATSAPDSSCSVIQKFCYDNIESNCATYGGLYTWTQAMCGAQTESTQGLCPSGWHVPSDPEFVTLVNYLGPGGCGPYPGGNYPAETFCGAPAGDRLKATGLCKGRTPCGDSEFNALLGGYFGYDTGPVFGSIADQGSFWTSSVTGDEAWRRGVALDYDGVDGSHFWTKITGGRSIRCVKD